METCVDHIVNPQITNEGACHDCLVENLEEQVELLQLALSESERWNKQVEIRNEKLQKLNQTSLNKLKEVLTALENFK